MVACSLKSLQGVYTRVGVIMCSVVLACEQSVWEVPVRLNCTCINGSGIEIVHVVMYERGVANMEVNALKGVR